MPTVHHLRVQQGWRPFTNPRGALNGLRGLGDSYDPGYVPGSVNADPFIAYEQSSPASAGECPLWDWFSDSCVSSNQAQIQSVADNAAKFYGPSSQTAQVAQQVATAQASQVPTDTANVQQFYDTGAGSKAGNALGIPTWGWLIIAFIVAKEL